MPIRQIAHALKLPRVSVLRRLQEMVKAREITHSLIDMVLEQDEKHQGRLLAQIVGSLSQSRRATTSGGNGSLLPPGFQDFDPAP
jgi:hypothetical protein